MPLGSPARVNNCFVPGLKPARLLRDGPPELLAEAVGVIGRPYTDVGTLGTQSNLPVQWQCGTCGHPWVASPASSTRGSGCPDCAWATRARSRAQAPLGKSVADLHPAIAAEFVANVSRPDMGPRDLRVASRQKCIWRCGRCSHEYQTTVVSRTNGQCCPKCTKVRFASERRRPSAASGTAAQFATFRLDELVANLTNPSVGMDQLRPNAVDRCRWRCSVCGHRWEATVVNRVAKGSGCPKCSTARGSMARRFAPPGRSLLALHSALAAEFVENLTAPSQTAESLWPGSNSACRWRCVRGHEWVTTVASRVAGAGCARCGGAGQSRLEFEVAELLRVVTGETVLLDARVRAGGRTRRVDLELPRIGLLIDLDPSHWHQHPDRDQRKVDALAGHRYVRVRPQSLPALTGTTVRVLDDNLAAMHWVQSLRNVLVDAGATFSEVSQHDESAALTRAAVLWQETQRGRPKLSASDAAPHLVSEFLGNLTRPGVPLEWVGPNTSDKCRWRCPDCGHEWTTSIASRAGQLSGCPKCARERITEGLRARSHPDQGEPSFADVRPDLTEEFVSCVSQPARSLKSLRPASNLRCRWRCRVCGHLYVASPADRLGGRGCSMCGRARAGLLRSRVPPERSLATLKPDLAAELIEVVDRADLSIADVSPGSNLRASWKCGECDHRWQASIASRAAGSGCPACGRLRTAAARSLPEAGKSLADLHPILAAEMVANATNPGRNADQMRPNSHDRCRWRCARGHEWEAVLKNRTRNGVGCPICYRSSNSREGC